MTHVVIDRAATLYVNTPVAGTGGAPRNVLTKVGTFFVGKVQVSSRTIIAGARDASETEDVFESRWFDGLANGMFMDVEGRRYRITRLDEMGRRIGWKIYARAVT